MPATDKLGPEISRRGFLAGSSGLTFALVFGAGANTLTPVPARASTGKLSAWVSIAPDGTVTILTPGAEMGQGSMTSVPLILADEMDADWSKVKLDWAPADAEVYGYRNRGRRSMAITGSHAVEKYFPDMRMAGAQVRKVLMSAAAEKWRVPVTEVTTDPGIVVHQPTGRKMSYGEIAGFAKVPEKLPKIGKADLKKASRFRLIGKSLPRRDIPAKVDGSARYAIDVHVPGMVYATTIHSPAQGGKPTSWNESQIKTMPGIVALVKLPTGVAIVGDRFHRVMDARSALEVKWSRPKSAGFDSEKALDTGYAKIADDAKAKSRKVHAQGDAKAAFAGAARTHSATFRSDYGYHAQMEPLNAVARLNARGDGVEVWDGTQAPDRVRSAVADALGFDEKNVTVHQCYLGGGMGRRSLGDYTVEAALVAKAVRKPVKLIWPREEDVAYGMFRPQTLQRMDAAVDGAGKVVGWKHCTVGQKRNLVTGGMRIKAFYDVPNQFMELRDVSHGIRVKHWRAVARVFNVFAVEGMVDELAAAAKMDPVEFRLRNMAPTKRAQAVMARVVEMSGWKTPLPEGRARGFSLAEKAGSLGAAVVEISLERAAGKIRVHKVWFAVDGGTIVQPEAARANIESAVINGISSVLTERITIKDGTVEQSNFHDYHVMRMSDAPEKVHIDFLRSRRKPGGLGELGNPPIPPAIANAFFGLTGKRLRHMPFTPERVIAALKA